MRRPLRLQDRLPAPADLCAAPRVSREEGVGGREGGRGGGEWVLLFAEEEGGWWWRDADSDSEGILGLDLVYDSSLGLLRTSV